MKTAAFLLSAMAASASAFSPSGSTTAFVRTTRLNAEMINIAEGVDFDTIAREWRCKWSPDDDKASLVEAQKALDSIVEEVKSVDGVIGVERVVCGGCLDFKVVTALPADKFGEWEEKGFAPEAEFVDKLKGIDGISLVETQTYTKMPC